MYHSNNVIIHSSRFLNISSYEKYEKKFPHIIIYNNRAYPSVNITKKLFLNDKIWEIFLSAVECPLRHKHTCIKDTHKKT